MDIIQNYMVGKVWKPSILKCLCKYLIYPSCHQQQLEHMFEHTNDGKVNFNCSLCRSYRKRRLIVKIVEVHEGRYKRMEGGESKDAKWFHLFHRPSCPAEKEEMKKNVMADLDCVARTVGVKT